MTSVLPPMGSIDYTSNHINRSRLSRLSFQVIPAEALEGEPKTGLERLKPGQAGV
jgi:hypothetical protein